MKPRDPSENGTTGGSGPLNSDAACQQKQMVRWYQIHIIETEYIQNNELNYK